MGLRYYLISLLLALILWAVVNFANRTTLSLKKSIQGRCKTYPKEVSLVLRLPEKFAKDYFLKKLRVYVNKRGEVLLKNPYPIFIELIDVSPKKVKLLCNKKGR